MGIQAYARRFTELLLFTSKDVPMNTLKASYFTRGLRDEIWLFYRSPRPLSYTELLNMALGVEDGQALIKNSATTRIGFLGRGAFRPRGSD